MEKTETKEPTIQTLPLTKDNVYEVLKVVEDPELNIDLVSLGLIYGVNVHEEEKVVDVTMTFTSPMCPFGEILVKMVKAAIKEQLGAKLVHVEITFEPRWQPTEEVKAMLGLP